jgi:hypothetical protein
MPNLSLDNQLLQEMADLGVGFSIDYVLLAPDDVRPST